MVAAHGGLLLRRTRANMSDATSGRPPQRKQRALLRVAGFAVLACTAVSLLLAGHTRQGAVHTLRRRPVPLAHRHAVPRVGRRAALALATRPASLHPARAAALPESVTLTPDRASGQSVGTTVRWTAIAAMPRGHAAVYRFSVGARGGALRMVRDFSPTPSFAWTALQTGAYTVAVTAKAGFAASSSVTARMAYLITSRVRGSAPVVTPTTNPLVALYSAPACRAGSLRVQFRPAALGDAPWTSTAAQPCQPGRSLTFLVAGMRAQTQYLLRSAIQTATGTHTSPPRTFTTGSLPSTLWFATVTVPVGPRPQSNQNVPVLLHMLTPAVHSVPNPVATDLAGNVLWNYATPPSAPTAIWPVT